MSLRPKGAAAICILVLALVSACAKSPSDRVKDAALDEIRRAPEVPLVPLELSGLEAGLDAGLEAGLEAGLDAGLGVRAVIDAPEGARESRRFQAVTVATETGDFAVVIERAHGDIRARKKVIDANQENRLVAYVIERGDALLYRSRRGQSRRGADERDEYHVLVHVVLDGVRYQCQDDKNERFFDTAAAHTMLRACTSLRTLPGPGSRAR